MTDSSKTPLSGSDSYQNSNQVDEKSASTTQKVVTYDDLSKHDKKAYRDFKRFLACKAAGHWERMLKRPFWRKYLGLDRGTGL